MGRPPGAPRSAYERVMARTASAASGDCWHWRGRVNPVTGYGKVTVKLSKGRHTTEYIHRVVWMRHNGKIPDDMIVAHTCGNRICVNPDHLRLEPKRAVRYAYRHHANGKFAKVKN